MLDIKYEKGHYKFISCCRLPCFRMLKQFSVPLQYSCSMMHQKHLNIPILARILVVGNGKILFCSGYYHC